MAAAALIAQAGGLRNNFTSWDDSAYLHRNRLVRDLAGLRDTWTSGAAPQYYPLTFTTFWVEYHLWGMDPLGYHAVNWLLHGVNAALVVVLLRRLGLSAGVAGAVGLLFGVAPFQAMSVAWVAERKNVLSTLFGLGSLICASDWLTRGRRRHGVAAWLLFAAALLSKSSWMLAPLACWAAGRWLHRAPARRVWALVVPQLLLAAGLAWLTHRFEQQYVDELIPPLAERWRIVPAALLWYVWTALLPVRLQPFYPRWELAEARLATVLPIVGLALLAALLAWQRRRLSAAQRWGLVLFVATLLPVLGLVAYGNLALTFVSDHYLYVACIGLYAAVIEPLARLISTWPRWRSVARPALGLIAAAMAIYSWTVAGVWRDDAALWQTVLARQPDSWLAYWGLAKGALVRGDRPAAMEYLRHVLLLRPLAGEARAEYGMLLIGLNQPAAAVEELQRALSNHPEPAEVWSNLGVALERAGRAEEAVGALSRAVLLAPADATSGARLGELLARRGRFREAVDVLRRTDARVPAIDAWRVVDSLSRILATAADPAVRDVPAALELARQNCALTPAPLPESLDTLALALSAAGDAPAALDAVERALAALAARPPRETDAALRERLLRSRARLSPLSTQPAAGAMAPRGGAGPVPRAAHGEPV